MSGINYSHLSPGEKRVLLARLLRERTDEVRNFPLAFAQERLWFLDQMEPGSPLYNFPLALSLLGSLDTDALERSIASLVQRHEPLRTTFTGGDEQPTQVIHSRLIIPLRRVDLSQIHSSERTAVALRLAKEEAYAPFDLSRGPLLRTLLLQLNTEEYILLFVLHHIIFDGWSIGVLLRDIAALYEAHLEGRAASLPTLAIQYKDFAIWQRHHLRGKELETHLAYWKEQLTGVPDSLPLPTDGPRPPVQTYQGGRRAFQIPLGLCEDLKALSRREGTTLFMTLLGAFAVLLARYSHQDDLVIGSPIAQRPHRHLEPLIGFFVNLLALRVDLSGSPSFRRLLQRLRTTCLQAYAHQDLPFAHLVEHLHPPRDLSRHPLFQVLFAFQNTPLTLPSLPGVKVSLLPLQGGTAKYDLSLEVCETAQGLQTDVEYNTDLFDSASISRLLTHWHTLLCSIVAHPDLSVWHLPLLSAAERQHLLLACNRTQTPRSPACLHQLVQAQAQRTPERIAVVADEHHLTYAALLQRTCQLAHRLRQLGVGPEQRVGLCAHRSVEMVVGLLAILQAGGAYVPLDPSSPAARLEFLLADARIQTLLVHRQVLDRLPRWSGQVLVLDDIPTEDQASLPPTSGVQPQNLAYLLYTSGSTGQPKGVLITHQAVVNRLLWMQEAYHLEPDDCVMQKTPFNFDVSIWEFFWPLITGARLMMARPGGHQDSTYLITLICEQGITTLHFVPPMLQVFLEERGLEKCHSLRRVICSGEALPAILTERFFARIDADLHNLYGPTEAAIDVTCWTCEPERGKRDARIIPIGHPISNTQIYLLDTHLEPVPIGVTGEVYIGGVALARGYFNRPDLTAERFLPHPFSSEPGARLYKTGDMARYLHDGTIEYLGRSDRQVKVRGFRIELGEIETVLSQHPAIAECVVTAQEDTSGDKRLIAYVVTHEREASSASGSQLRTYLRDRLPDYMLPSAFVKIDALPLTSNGKGNVRALPPPQALDQEYSGAYSAPGSEIERIIAEIWQEVLHRERIGSHDNFFDLGGHSLLMLQTRRKLEDRVHREIALIDLFRYPSVSALASFLSQQVNRPDTLPETLARAERRTEAMKKQKQLRHARDTKESK